MASPFRYFRKHQKAFLAIAAVLAMFIFVAGDLIMGCVRQAGQARGGSPNAIVTSWDGGSLTVRELDLLSQRRYFLNEFLSNLYQLGKYRAEEAGDANVEPDVPMFFLGRDTKPAEVMGLCVQERIMADQARQAGMTISNLMINDFLRRTGLQRVSDKDIKNILQRIRRYDMRTTEEWLFSGLRELLLGRLYTDSMASSVAGVSPAQLWEDWRHINDRIALEAVILPVDTFMADVPEPSEGNLIALYELYKNRVGGVSVSVMNVQLPSPEPGFREPRRVKLKYLMGDVTTWTQEMLPSITDEQIADYYERNKRTQFVKMDHGEEASADVSSSEETSGEEASADVEAPQSKDASEQSGMEQETTVDEDEEQGDEGEEASADGEDQDEDASEEPDAEQKDAGDENEENLEYEPLEKVKDDIRNQLANEKAVIELKRVMESAYGDLTTIFNRYGGERVAAEAEDRQEPPVPERLVDLAPLAKEKKLVYEETAPLSDREMFETMVGKAVDVQSGSRNVTRAAFTDLRLYEPFLAQDIDGYWYLVLKVEDLPSRVPELEDIHDEVATAWKRREAAKLAQQKSEQLAQEAEESGKSLTDFFADSGYEVTTTDLFSWITFGNTPVEMQQGPRLGDAPPLTAVGPDFMRQVFALKGPEVIGLLNFDHTQAYVLKLARRERTEDELRRAFLSDVNNSQAMRILEALRTQNNQRVLMNEILRNTGLDTAKLQRFLQSVSKQ